MRTPVFIMLAASLIAANHAMAADGEMLANKNNCMMCHAMDGKSTGPSFREIATKYKNTKEAQTTLEAKVRNGGKGVWGSMPMPATARSVSDGDIKSMVRWLLLLK